MPECLDNMPWRSLKGLGDMAPDFLRLGDFKNVRLKDDTLVQFRIIGFKHDVTKSGRILPLTWEMVDCLQTGIVGIATTRTEVLGVQQSCSIR